MLFYLVVDQTAASTYVSGCHICLCLHSKNILVIKNPFFKFKVLYVLKTHFDWFNSHVNNLEDMARELLFYRHEAIFWKN